MARQPDFAASMRALRKDPKMARIVRRYGAPDLSTYHKGAGTVFARLLRSIVYQQISGKAAAAILERVLDLFPRRRPTPERLLALKPEVLRAAGLSSQKVAYAQDLARKFLDGTIDERAFPHMTSEEIIEHVVQVRGIGVWTAHMLLIFTLYRPDILPWGDLGIRKAFKEVYGLKKLPDKKTMERIARPWRAHASAASWYLWRVADASSRARDVQRPRKRRKA